MMGTITVVNKYHGKEGVYIGRPSVFGNPYSNKENTLAKYKTDSREESIYKYKEWLYAQSPESLVIKEIIKLLKEIRDGKDVNLVCFCAPKSCHGDIIKQYIEEKLNEESVC